MRATAGGAPDGYTRGGGEGENSDFDHEETGRRLLAGDGDAAAAPRSRSDHDPRDVQEGRALHKRCAAW